MEVARFIAVGENIHCTRIYKVGGKFCREADDGSFAIHYKADGADCALSVPDTFIGNADWESGKVKHCAVAIWQGVYGDDANQAIGKHYIQALAKRQEAAGADYLDINVDEFSTDVDERVRLMEWTVAAAQEATAIPVSVDSSNMQILEAGLAACDTSRGKAMVNSVSLERESAVDVAAKYGAVVIASAAGETGLPNATEERVANLDAIITRLKDVGFALGDIHADPLVFPIAVDSENGNRFLDTVRAVRGTYGPDLHIVAGLSNVSFGMPNRKLINQVFTHLAVQAGADGGIVDPLQINADMLRSLDTGTEDYKLAEALLTGQDEFGMAYITALQSR